MVCNEKRHKSGMIYGECSNLGRMLLQKCTVSARDAELFCYSTANVDLSVQDQLKKRLYGLRQIVPQAVDSCR